MAVKDTPSRTHDFFDLKLGRTARRFCDVKEGVGTRGVQAGEVGRLLTVSVINDIFSIMM